MKNTVQPPWSLPIGILADAEKELRLLKSVANILGALFKEFFWFL
jgi:hypothetical protein